MSWSQWRGPTIFVPTYSGGRKRAAFSQGCRSLLLIWTITSGPMRWIKVGAPMLATSLSPAGGRRRRSVCQSISGVEGHSPGPSTLSVSARGVIGQGVRRQHHSSGVYSQAGRNSLASPERGGSTPAPVGRESVDSSSASVCDGHSQRGCRHSLATQRGDRFRVDPGSGSGGSTGSSLASEHRSICHGSESSDASLLCSDGGPSIVGHRHFSNVLIIFRHTLFLLFG